MEILKTVLSILGVITGLSGWAGFFYRVASDKKNQQAQLTKSVPQTVTRKGRTVILPVRQTKDFRRAEYFAEHGDYDLALKTYKKLARQLEKKHESIELARIYTCMAICWQTWKPDRPAKQMECYKQALAIYEILASEKPENAAQIAKEASAVKANMANVLLSQKTKETAKEAIKIREEVVAERLARLGAGHWETIEAQEALAKLYAEHGFNPQAESLHALLADCFAQKLYFSAMSVTQACRNQSKQKEFVAWKAKAVAVNQAFAITYPHAGETEAAISVYNAGNYEEARRLFEALLPKEIAWFEAGHPEMKPRIGQAYMNLANACRNCPDSDSAQVLGYYREALRYWQDSPRELAMVNLAMADLLPPKEAWEHLDRAISLLEQHAPEDPGLADAYIRAAKFHCDNNEILMALTCANKAEQAIADKNDTIALLNVLQMKGAICISLSQKSVAVECFERAIALSEQAMPNHPMIKSLRKNLEIAQNLP